MASAQSREIAAQLRCVVCQSLSVADSPSETAHQMRGVIRERFAAGETPEQVKAYFVDKYGLWILLEPPRQRLQLCSSGSSPMSVSSWASSWSIVVVRRWSRRPKTAPVETRPVDEATRQRIRRELAEMDGE